MSENELSDTITRITGARSVEFGEVIQSLWSGYGVIQRATLLLASPAREGERVVIKHVDLSGARPNRRGWGGENSHRRKVHSYEVETRFYESFSKKCDASCRVPSLIAFHENLDNSGRVMVLEDLDFAGFAKRKGDASALNICSCLSWLANFHATFMGDPCEGLWPIGTYWHLATRTDEYEAMPEGMLKRAAKAIDHRLNEATYQTVLHGDAKLANFCFSESNANRVAAVDFQYVGRGCGMKDVAYFISSCLDGADAAEQQEQLLQWYFQQLRIALSDRDVKIDADAVEAEWRALYPIAWADFARFLTGWSPDHWKLNRFVDEITETALRTLAQHDGA
ncbi:MAG: oxidoreductase family protein [Planctomycetota bacterium]